MERERRERMARIRAENESEEAAVPWEQAPPPMLQNGSERILEVTFREEEEEEELMERLFGVSSFGSSKNTKVATNHATAAVGVAQKHKARKYRQYMNRKNGFNRPLDNV
jgi:U4/U6.U5 tri-snRNP-associated protein 3